MNINHFEETDDYLINRLRQMVKIQTPEGFESAVLEKIRASENIENEKFKMKEDLPKTLLQLEQ